MNGDGFAGNDLIYIPRDTGEMNFVTFTHTNGRVFTAAEQATAFEAYIQQDPYLSERRGEYAQRGGMFLPMFNRMDVSLIQDIFKNIGGKRNSGQIRFDVTNFGNLLKHDWGVIRRMVAPTTAANGAQILTNTARRCAEPRELSHGSRQQRAHQVILRDGNGCDGRVPVSVELQVYVQLGRLVVGS